MMMMMKITQMNPRSKFCLHHSPCCSAQKMLMKGHYFLLKFPLIMLMSAFTMTLCALTNIVANTGSTRQSKLIWIRYQNQKLKNKHHQKTISTSVSLVKAIFEETVLAFDIHKHSADQNHEDRFIDPAIAMFNNNIKSSCVGYTLSKVLFMRGPIVHWIRNHWRCLRDGVCSSTMEHTRTCYVPLSK